MNTIKFVKIQIEIKRHQIVFFQFKKSMSFIQKYQRSKQKRSEIWKPFHQKMSSWGMREREFPLELSARRKSTIFAPSSTAFFPFCSFHEALDFNSFIENTYFVSFCLHSLTGNSPSTGLGLGILFCSSDQDIRIKLWVEPEFFNAFWPLVWALVICGP